MRLASLRLSEDILLGYLGDARPGSPVMIRSKRLAEYARHNLGHDLTPDQLTSLGLYFTQVPPAHTGQAIFELACFITALLSEEGMIGG